MTDWIAVARKCGFDEAGYLKVDTLAPLQAVRDACAEDKCRSYGKNWTCPPRCGTVEECGEKMKAYKDGILMQTVGELEDSIDMEGYADAAKRHGENFNRFCMEIRKEFPDALCLGAGRCSVCEKCAFPEPCRFPDRQQFAMEGFGLLVTQVCKDNDMPYYHGPLTITYSACVLYNRKG